MGDVCLSGLQGFPVQITGWSGFTEKLSLVIPNDIQLQFSPSNLPMTYNSDTGELTQASTASTFFMGGTLFTVRSVRISKPKQEGLKNFSAEPVAEFQIWGNINPTGVPKADLGVIVIPIYTKVEESDQGLSIMNAISGRPTQLLDCIPSGKGVSVIRYVTCIETDSKDKKTVKISVAYFSNGVPINQVQTTRLTRKLAPAGIPNIFGFKVLSQFEQYNDTARSKGDRRYLVESNISIAYQTSVGLSATTAEFKNGFRIINDFQKRGSASKSDIGAYRCIAIDRQRDIRKNQLLVDPKTGRRLSDEVALANEQDQESLEKKGNLRDTLLTVAIVIGVILGLSALALLFVFLATMFFNRKGQGITTPIPPEVQKMYDTMPPNLVGK
jgi:hypothetical protein